MHVSILAKLRHSTLAARYSRPYVYVDCLPCQRVKHLCCHQILPISDDPGQVLRTATKGIGTDSYRAPEVNGYHSYDPSAADVWSLGVTLFFLVSK